MTQIVSRAEVLLLLLAVALALFPASQVDASGDENDSVIAVVLPIGMEALLPRPRGRAFIIYASAEGIHPSLSRADAAPGGAEASGYFPSPLSFRVTATTLGMPSEKTPPSSFDTNMQTPELISGLRFRLRVSPGGLRTERIEPADTRQIGIPADVPYGERIYRVTFDHPPLPMTDRLVLEVMSPEGELLCKFPLVVN